MKSVDVSLAFVLLSLLSGCSSGDEGDKTGGCTQGQQISCGCPTGSGVQVCGADATYGPCSCSTPSGGGGGGAHGAGTTGSSGTTYGGAPPIAGIGGATAGGTTTGGSAGGGGVNTGGTAGGADCYFNSDDYCTAHCTQTTGHCEQDVPYDFCMTTCTTAGSCADDPCLELRITYAECRLAATPTCLSGVTFPIGTDCKAQSDALFACMGYAKVCEDDGESCSCSWQQGGTPSGCTSTYDCCVADQLTRGVCTCSTQEVCDGLAPVFTAVASCPVP